ncbi:MAG TPA: hypothetical protein VGM90_30330 [Kofleriaceae bacterium]
MGFGISRRARSKRAKGGLRALFGRAPDAKEVGTRLSLLAKRVLGGEIISEVTTKRVTLDLHPEAMPVKIQVLPDGDIEVTGDTARLGPGYHRTISPIIAPLLDEMDFVWADVEADPRVAMPEWLSKYLAGGKRSFGLSKEMQFKIDAAVLTPMGPRDAAWRDAVIKDPTTAQDAFAWWEDGAGRAELAAALIGMWLRCPWREPLDTEERDVMMSIDGALRAAKKLDPALPIPYAEWAQVRTYLGADKDRVANLVEKAAGAEATIGYRRFALEVEVDSWRLDVPGCFVANDEEEKYWATDGDRLVELVTITTDGAQSSQELLDIAPPKHPVVERMDDSERRGRVEIEADGDVKVLHGIMASTPHVALLTCKSNTGDIEWARDVWRSLRVR